MKTFAAYDRMNERQRRLTSLIAQGLSNKAIAEKEGSTVQVIKNYLREVYDIAGVDGRLELAIAYTQRKMEEQEAAQQAERIAHERTVIAGGREVTVRV